MICTVHQGQQGQANGTVSNVSSSEANDRFIKAMDELQLLYLKRIQIVLKQKSIDLSLISFLFLLLKKQ